jgi:hypothetical protein
VSAKGVGFIGFIGFVAVHRLEGWKAGKQNNVEDRIQKTEEQPESGKRIEELLRVAGLSARKPESWEAIFTSRRRFGGPARASGKKPLPRTN